MELRYYFYMFLFSGSAIVCTVAKHMTSEYATVGNSVAFLGAVAFVQLATFGPIAYSESVRASSYPKL